LEGAPSPIRTALEYRPLHPSRLVADVVDQDFGLSGLSRRHKSYAKKKNQKKTPSSHFFAPSFSGLSENHRGFYAGRRTFGK
jgi:hypothetical protein